jgi:hypothetical protein
MSSFLFFYGILALPFELRKFHFLKFHFVEYSNGNRQFFIKTTLKVVFLFSV